jgi:hypothetical protein
MNWLWVRLRGPEIRGAVANTKLEAKEEDRLNDKYSDISQSRPCFFPLFGYIVLHM